MNNINFLRQALVFLIIFCTSVSLQAQEKSVARQWNEQLLYAIRHDFARPVVHARNLYHVSAGMYDCWSLINRKGSPSMMLDVTAPISMNIDTWRIPYYEDRKAASEEAISYVAYRLLKNRYANAPGLDSIGPRLDSLMISLGYDIEFTDRNYYDGPPAALGNYVASKIIGYGYIDQSNEYNDYDNVDYPSTVNPPLEFTRWVSVFSILDPNHWQTLAFEGSFVDQSGYVVGDGVPPFLGASWGRVTPFAIPDSVKKIPTVDYPIRGNSPLYHDPGRPPHHQLMDTAELNQYRWNFETVLRWSSHLDPTDSVYWDISPNSIGNFQGEYPSDPADYPQYYMKEGGIAQSIGYDLNPVTGQPYEENIVPRGDYTRVLAEYWADGPESETPPGHWFVILNEVMDHPLFERKFEGTGEELTPLEYDLKAYLSLGGAMHDAAITAWSIKGAYDYIRPISAIRWLARQGQASDPTFLRYNPGGMQFDPGYIEPLNAGDTVSGEVVFSRIRALAWKGPDAINDTETDFAGVGWIDPINWYPYQKSNFVTPNFAGYVSGHSTFSSAAAQILELMTGSPYFPGGLGEFVAKKDEFLEFEDGPSVDVVLQWATYRDASDETSLSRIWGGIHPPIDDIPGRIIGIDVGNDAFNKVREIFNGNLSDTESPVATIITPELYPNPAVTGANISISFDAVNNRKTVWTVYNVLGSKVANYVSVGNTFEINTQALRPGQYFLKSDDGIYGASFQVF